MIIINSNQLSYRYLMGSDSNLELRVRSFLTGLSAYAIGEDLCAANVKITLT